MTVNGRHLARENARILSEINSSARKQRKDTQEFSAVLKLTFTSQPGPTVRYVLSVLFASAARNALPDGSVNVSRGEWKVMNGVVSGAKPPSMKRSVHKMNSYATRARQLPVKTRG